MNARAKKSLLRPFLTGFWALLGATCGISGNATAQALRANPAILPVNDPACIAAMAGQCVLRAAHGSLEMKLSENGQMTAVFSAPLNTNVNAVVSAPPNQPSGSGEGGALASGKNVGVETLESSGHAPTGAGEKATLEASPVEPSVEPAVAPSIALQVEDDLEFQVQKGQMTEEDASQIAADMVRLDGAIYQVPTLDQIEVDLGLPAEAQEQGIGESGAQQDFEELVCAHLQVTLGVGPQTAFYLASRLGVQVIALAPPPGPSALPTPSRN